MPSITDILEPYAELESEIRQHMIELFSESCGLCTACCCRADICEETGHSAFLTMLLEMQDLKADEMDDRYGWLDLHGCSLAYGRPPVCYAFFCDELMDSLPDEEAREVVRILGRLMHHVGERALDERHLVELQEPEQLEQVDISRLFRRLADAQAALEVIEAFSQTGRLTQADRGILDRICTNDP